MAAEQAGTNRTEIRVRYAETDQMGLAHHMNYLAWFELGRIELMRANGLSYAELEEQGVLLPVAHAELDFRLGASFDDRVWIHSRVKRVRSRSITLEYEAVLAEDESLLARGTTTLVCTDSELQLRRLPEDAFRILERLKVAAARGALIPGEETEDKP